MLSVINDQWDRWFLLSFSADLYYIEHFLLQKERKSEKGEEESCGTSVVVNIYNHCVPPSREFIIKWKGQMSC